MSLLDEIVANIESIVCKDELKKYLFRNVCFVNDEDMYVIETALSQREDIDARWRKSIYAQLLKSPKEGFIVNMILQEWNLRYLKGRGFYLYTGKYWKYTQDEIVSKKIGDLLGKWKQGNKVRSILKLLKDECITEEEFNKKDVICFQNGTLHLESGLLKKHSPKDLCSIIMSYDYDETKKSKEWAAFVMDICNGKQYRYDKLQLLCGYILMSDCHLQKCFIFYGTGANGKSVFMNIISNVFGQENVTHLQLVDMYDKFQLIQLESALLNLGEDSGSSLKGGDSELKRLSAGDRVSACYKGKDFISFRSRAKLIFAMNDILFSSAINQGILRRLSTIMFEVHFVDDPKLPEEKKIDRNLEDKLSKELSGIFNWCYEGYLKLKDVDCFARDEDDIEMERMFLDVSSPLYGYYVQMEPLKRFTPTREIYDNYLFWCRDKGIKPKALSTFSSQFALVSRSSYKKNDSYKDENGKHIRGYEPL